MGWKVLKVEYLYQGKYYDKYNYDHLVNKKIKLDKIKNAILKNVKKLILNINRLTVFLILFKYLESLIVHTI